jgi:RNA polymerase sigma-70 factor (ECF subfamily)
MERSTEITELARRAKNGDKRAFEDLCKAKTRSIICNAKSMLGDIDDTMDVYSETMLAMYKRIKKLRSPEAVDVWILRYGLLRHFMSRNNVFMEKT